MWYKNHSGDKETGGPKPRLKGGNPLGKFMSSRRVSPMRLWASHNIEEVFKKAGSRDIGLFSSTSARLWRKLELDERTEWEQRAVEHNKDKADQCYLYVKPFCLREVTEGFVRNQHVFMEVLADYLSDRVGFGPNQLGMCTFRVIAVFRGKNGKTWYEE